VLRIFTIIQAVDFASGLIAGGPQFDLFLDKYKAALDRAIEIGGVPDKNRFLQPLADAFLAYLRHIRVPDAIYAAAVRNIELYLANLP
jgi:hypothetical protein